MPAITPVLAGFELGGGFLVAIAVAFAATALAWSVPAGLAGALAGRRLARRPAAGWCVGWCAGVVAAGLVAGAGLRAGLPVPVAAICGYVPVWCAAAALARRATPPAGGPVAGQAQPVPPPSTIGAP